MTAETDAINKVLSGLVKRGCTPAEALDYYMADIGPYNQTEWANIRGVDQSTVSENVAKARKKMAES